MENPNGNLGGCKACWAGREVMTMNHRYYAPDKGIKGEPKRANKSRRYRTRSRDDNERRHTREAFPVRSLIARYRDLQNRH